MNKDVLLGIVRHILTGFGGAGVATGLVGQDEVTTIISGFVALVGVVWSIANKQEKT